MRVEEIKSIKYVRNFLNFSGNNVFLHKKTKKDGKVYLFDKILIYAPNGEGKTNLSRLFDCISNSEKNIEELLSQEASQSGKELSFSFCINGEIINEVNFKTDENQKILNNFYIFNSDYLEENVKCSDFSKKNINGAILIPLGKENIKIQTLESELEQKSKDRRTQKDALVSLVEKMKINLKINKYKGKDISIWQEFDLGKCINENFEIEIPVKKEGFDSCEDKFQQIKGLNVTDKIQYHILQIAKEKIDKLDDIFDLLMEEKIFSKVDKEAEGNVSYIIKNWLQESFLLKKGIKESEKENKCLLCNRKIDFSVEELFKKYKNYFEDEKGKFETKVEQLKNDLQLLKNDLLKINNNSQGTVEKFIEIFSLGKKWTDISTNLMIREIEKLDEQLDSKKLNSQIDLKFSRDVKTEIEALNERIKKNNIIIDEINKKIENSSHEETELRKTIGQKCLHDFYRDNKIIFDQIFEINNEVKSHEEKLKIERIKLPKADALSNIVLLFNKFLHDFIGLNKYTSEIVDGSISLHLNNVDISKETKKISEGEKTIIGLCYFLASSIQKFESPEKYKDLIVIIDDPICSTSYGNFFGICNLLKEFEDIIYKKLWSHEIKPKIQKIVLTHNTQFFNMLRGNIFKEKALYFMLNQNELKIIPNKKLISEFETALCRICEASKDENFDGNIGNDMRRFFETLRHFYGFHQFDADSIKLVFSDFEESRHKEFYSAINYYSHGNPEAGTDPLPPENILKLLEEFVFLIQKSQFKDLWKNIEKLTR